MNNVKISNKIISLIEEDGFIFQLFDKCKITLQKMDVVIKDSCFCGELKIKWRVKLKVQFRILIFDASMNRSIYPFHLFIYLFVCYCHYLQVHGLFMIVLVNLLSFVNFTELIFDYIVLVHYYKLMMRVVSIIKK